MPAHLIADDFNPKHWMRRAMILH